MEILMSELNEQINRNERSVPCICHQTYISFGEQACVIATVGVHKQEARIHHLSTKLTHSDVLLKMVN